MIPLRTWLLASLVCMALGIYAQLPLQGEPDGMRIGQQP